MITKAELKRYRGIDGEMRQLERLMRRLRERAEAPRIAIMSDMPRGRGKEADYMAAHTARVDELMCRYETLREELIDLQQHIEAAVERLDPTGSRLIRLRYFEGFTWERICVDMGYSWKHIHRLHGKALSELSAA